MYDTWIAFWLIVFAFGTGWVAAKVHAEVVNDRRDRARQDANMRATLRGRR